MLWKEIHTFDWSRRLSLLWDFCFWEKRQKQDDDDLQYFIIKYEMIKLKQ